MRTETTVSYFRTGETPRIELLQYLAETNVTFQGSFSALGRFRRVDGVELTARDSISHGSIVVYRNIFLD